MSVTIGPSVEHHWVKVDEFDYCGCAFGNCMESECYSDTLGNLEPVSNRNHTEFYCLQYWRFMQRSADMRKFMPPKIHCPYCSCEGTGHAPIMEYLPIDDSIPEGMNMANSVFRTFADALGIDCIENEGLCGRIEVADLDNLIKRSIKLLNQLEPMATETVKHDSHSYKEFNKETGLVHIQRSCQLIECGRDEEYWKMRLRQFINICKVAKKKNITVTFG
jgi:hypothetical protein